MDARTTCLRMGLMVIFALSAAVPTPARALDCSRPPGVLPNPALPAGSPDPENPIEHVIVIMQENHSFDTYFGKLDDPRFYGNEVDGIDNSMSNPDQDGKTAYAFHQESYCVADPLHDWDTQHFNWDWGRNDRFALDNEPDGARVLGYYTDADLNFYYALANEFAISDRYFCSAITQTLPNRSFLLSGSSFGHIDNDLPAPLEPWKKETIFDVLQQYGVSWKYYYTDWPYLSLFNTFWSHLDHTALIPAFEQDLQQGKLPSVSFVESSALGSDEHPPNDIQKGQKSVAARVKEIVNSAYWSSSVLFLTYDENGGYFDHVPPPEACDPGDVPAQTAGHFPAGYDHFGFRVPFVAISPYARHHYVSHVPADHTSILRFIENKFNVPSLTRRDANAYGLEDLFDFGNPILSKPDLPEPDYDSDKAFKCIIPPGFRGL